MGKLSSLFSKFKGSKTEEISLKDYLERDNRPVVSEESQEEIHDDQPIEEEPIEDTNEEVNENIEETTDVVEENEEVEAETVEPKAKPTEEEIQTVEVKPQIVEEPIEDGLTEEEKALVEDNNIELQETKVEDIEKTKEEQQALEQEEVELTKSEKELIENENIELEEASEKTNDFNDEQEKKELEEKIVVEDAEEKKASKKKKKEKEEEVEVETETEEESKVEVTEEKEEPVVEEVEEPEETEEESEPEPEPEIEVNLIASDNAPKKEEVIAEPIQKEEIKDEDIVIEDDDSDDELSQTMAFRKITVDKEDLEFNDIEVPEEMIVPVKKEPEPEPTPEEEQEEKIKVQLKLLKQRKHISKCLLDKIVYIKTDEISTILKVINDGNKLKNYEASIRDVFQKVYIDGRYYNYCGNVNTEFNKDNLIELIDTTFVATEKELINQFSGRDLEYGDKVKKYHNIFRLILNIEEVYYAESDVEKIRLKYLDLFKKYYNVEYSNINEVVNKIIKEQDKYLGVRAHILNELESKVFKLKVSNVSENKYACRLDHSVKFSKIYSDYIIEKMYNDSVVAENKLPIYFTMVNREILKNIINKEFKKVYYLYVCDSLYDKKNKYNGIFNYLDDEYVKISTNIVISIKTLRNHVKVLSDLRKRGFKFSLHLDPDDDTKDLNNVDLVENIFVGKQDCDAYVNLNPEYRSKVVIDDLSIRLGIGG